MVLGFWDIAVPIVGAPMAGGPSTPALAAAVSNAGGLGFIAAGYLSAERFAEDIAAARAATTGPLGVNLLVPQPSVADWVQLDYYAEELEEIAEHYQVEVGHPQLRRRRRLGAQTRGGRRRAPGAGVLHLRRAVAGRHRRLGALGLLVMVTVTSAYEAGVAIAAGADSLVVQGPDAGGHRGTFAPDMEPGTESLHELLARIRSAHRDVPLDRGGRPGHRRGRRRGAEQGSGGRAGRHRPAAQRRSRHQRRAPRRPEASAVPRHLVTRAFSGRYARSLENEFTRLLDRWRRWATRRSTR